MKLMTMLIVVKPNQLIPYKEDKALISLLFRYYCSTFIVKFVVSKAVCVSIKQTFHVSATVFTSAQAEKKFLNIRSSITSWDI